MPCEQQYLCHWPYIVAKIRINAKNAYLLAFCLKFIPSSQNIKRDSGAFFARDENP